MQTTEPASVPSLKEQHYAILLQVLRRFLNEIDGIGLYGSRARGDHRPNSDIDLVLYGDDSFATLAKLKYALDESSLPLEVDVVVYNQLTSQVLKAEIDKQVVRLV